MPKYVLRFTDDGLYNEGDGFPVPLSQATVYTSRAVAEARQHNLFDCEIVEIPDGENAMTEELLQRLEALEAAATDGPWEVNMDADIEATNVLHLITPDDPRNGLMAYRVAGFPYTHEGSRQRRDAALIVEMRNNLVPLIKAARGRSDGPTVQTEHERERDKVAALSEQVRELKLALSWYVAHDDTNETPDNAEWLEGKRRAIALLGDEP